MNKIKKAIEESKKEISEKLLKAVIEEIEDQFEVYKDTKKVMYEFDSERNETLNEIINLIKESIN